ncbi:MAG TPA: glucoamylase family protein [Gemmataceae bacterium]|jgi:cyclic beta-1,2-glucan synthetase
MQARLLAGACQTAARTATEGPLLQQLARNGRLLVEAYRKIAEAAQNLTLTPDAEWLLDNFYIVEEVLREIRHDLPRGYYQKLPKLAGTPLAGYPRVYALALALIAHTDSNLDDALIARFVQAFQTVVPLTIGEVWAVPTMLRLGLIENLRRMSEHMLRVWAERRRAEAWVEPLLQTGAEPRQSLGIALEQPSDTFVIRALQVLRQGGRPAALEQAEELLARRGLDVNEVVRRENQRQAANQVSAGNCLTSLRLLPALDWNIFFERTNLVEPLLRQDPAGAYARQDFATRDRYRQVVEKLARGSDLEEVEVARRVLQKARGESSPRNHVGYYLIGPGKPAFQAELGYRPILRERLLDAVLAHPSTVYFGAITGLLVLLLALLFVAVGLLAETVQPWIWVLASLAALVPVSELAVTIVNSVLTLLLPPRTLPKLEFPKGIPADCATFVVMPSMLVRPDSAASLAERLEIHYLANPDPQLRFALLTDFADSPVEHRPEDEGYLHDALERIAALNRRYAPKGPSRFFLFHRKRQQNPSEGCWMGWERKRGKLNEFNRLLRGDANTSYTVQSAPPPSANGISEGTIPRIRFVITLDLDSQLLNETVSRLVGTLAHPLNQARLDPVQGHVVEGYAILQPRISFSMPAAHRSRFTHIWARSVGVDPYQTAVSDIYQDLFGSGSFTGKGIYDVDAFEASTGATFPDNHILRHDLIEGNYARCGLVADIELFEDFPVRYPVYARREHRWIRGDWQLLPWLGRKTPVPATGNRELRNWRPNPLPLLERWKIFDNLRRSLVPPALVLWLVLSWTVLPLHLGLSTGLALVVLVLPLLLQVLGTLVHAVKDRSLAGVRELARNGWITAAQVLMNGIVLLNQAYLSVDAFLRTLVRLWVTRRHLLEWETAPADRCLGANFKAFGRTMWQAPALALACAALVLGTRPESLPASAGFLLAWFLSPLIAWWVSQDRQLREKPLSASARRELGIIARKTWGFFESFVREEVHWLPPDNFQEEPRQQLAHQTSPTNQGLLLVSTLAAHDFGYLTLSSLAERLEKTMDALDRLERYRGHFYNWYDARSLEPLQPRYISTVDSGNLAGCLLTLKQGLLEKIQTPFLGPADVNGLTDTFHVLEEVWGHLGAVPGVIAGLVLKALEEELRQTPHDLLSWLKWLHELKGRTAAVAEVVRRLSEAGSPSAVELDLWTRRLGAAIEKHNRELAELAPWLELLSDPRATAFERADAETVTRWQALRQKLTTAFRLSEFESDCESWQAELKVLTERPGIERAAAGWLRQVAEAVERSSAGRLLERCRRLAERAEAMAGAMDFRFLYKSDRHLLAIGYNVPQGRLDAACYDLLASEARLSSYLAIARGDVPRRHWFHLSRTMVRAGGELCLVSWGGTMFEYLMPQLFLRRYAGTLLEASCQASVAEQISYGREHRVPWGISESACSQYVKFNYQYQTFGVPTLGLKRGLAQDLVVAPYATALASIVRPHEALRNFRRLAAEGATGKYGFYEAIDYTRSRLPENQRALVVPCFMAHHQGMSLVALANCLLGNVMVRRFHAEPMVRATELLLQERVPSNSVPVDTPDEEAAPRPPGQSGLDLLSRRLITPNTPGPRTHLLSNGQYLVMVTNAGSGFSRCGDLDVTRWREDYTRDDWGQFCYLRDLSSGQTWSAGHQPLCRPTKHYEVVYSADKAEFRRVDGAIATHLEITVAPEHCAEVRRVTLTNHDRRAHDMELTSYAEVVMAPHEADLAHPAFGKLFLQTEWVASHGALLCHRRPRASGQESAWAVHVVSVEGQSTSDVHYETDRTRFLGRGRTPAAPAALDPGATLSNTTGPALDAVFSIRRRFRLEASGVLSVLLCTGVAKSRDEALALADHYRDGQAVARAFDLAWAHSQVEMRHVQIATADVHLFQRVATHLIYAGPVLRAGQDVLTANRQDRSGLWRYGISGEMPILLVRVGAGEDLPLVRHILLAHSYWRLKGLAVDLVILCEQSASSVEELFQQIQEAVRSSHSHGLADKPGGVFVRKTTHMPEEDQVLLQSAARVVLLGRRGSLAVQLAERVDRAMNQGSLPERFKPSGTGQQTDPFTAGLPPLPPLLFENGLGGFSQDGREYIVTLAEPSVVDPESTRGQEAWAPPTLPPAPWVNVVANPFFGFLISESGGGYSWAGNSQSNRLTPWNNDPVCDPPGEVLYLRDEETGNVWTPTPLPLGGRPTRVWHGQGYTFFEQASYGLHQEVLFFVPVSDPVKVIRLKVKNADKRSRRLSATFYAEWVLGNTRDQAAMQILTELDTGDGALLARNAFRARGKLAFVDVSLRPRTWTADRTEFLGRNGSVYQPAALGRLKLSGQVGENLDPCAALMAPFQLEPGEEREIVFLLGEADGRGQLHRLLRDYKEPGRVRAAFEEVCSHWEERLTVVQVETPDDRAMGLLLNRWLLYQVVSCNLWARSSFYQSVGGCRFRDQLLGVLALLHTAPREARTLLLRAAGRQFLDGDVLHEWDPATGKGTRVCSQDNLLWLPFATYHYVSSTGELDVLEEQLPFLENPPEASPSEDRPFLPGVTEETRTLYEHCSRAIDRAFDFEPYQLPMTGTSDKDRTDAGRESKRVWNAWFLLTCLRRFAELDKVRGETDAAKSWGQKARWLGEVIEKHAWGGAWYRQACRDDGTPPNSGGNDECLIDLLAQSWAALSGAADPDRVCRAVEAAYDCLAGRGRGPLFTPQSDNDPRDPEGVRDRPPDKCANRADVTQAAVWTVQALALLGQGTRAVKLFGLINPITHTSSPVTISRYRVEPYVLAEDPFREPPDAGRGGWTWYTGAASSLYHVALAAILGFNREGDHLRIDPCVPTGWRRYAIAYRHITTLYQITVENPYSAERGVLTVVLDGCLQKNKSVPLVDDGKLHEIRVVLAAAAAESQMKALLGHMRNRDWESAANSASDLGNLYLSAGDPEKFLTFTRLSVKACERGPTMDDRLRQLRLAKMVDLADALHRLGHLSQAESAFLQAEKAHLGQEPGSPYLHSLAGFRYCDLLLTLERYEDVQSRAEVTHAWSEQRDDFLGVALDDLSLGLAELLKVEKEGSGSITSAEQHVDRAMKQLGPGQADFFLRALLARAEIHRAHDVLDRAEKDLTDATALADRAELLPRQVDCRLARARLFLYRIKPEEARKCLAEVQRLIPRCGYLRRAREADELEEIVGLVLRLQDNDPTVRAEAARQSGARAAREARPALLARQQDKDAIVRQAAEEALRLLSRTGWAQEITFRLRETGRVSPKDLSLGTDSEKVKALSEYVEAHPELDLRGFPNQELYFGRSDVLGRINELWRVAQSVLASDRAQFLLAAEPIGRYFSQIIGLAFPADDPKWLVEGRVAALPLSQPPAFTEWSILSEVYLAFLQRERLSESDIDDLHRILTKPVRQRGRVLFLLWLAGGEHLAESRRLLDEKLRQVHALNIVLFDLERILTLLKAKDLTQTLRKFVFADINLEFISPFIRGGSTPGNMFFGRENLLVKITSSVPDKSYALYAGRRLGKTSILQRLHQARLPEAGFHPFFFSCERITRYPPTKDDFLVTALKAWHSHEAESKDRGSFSDVLQRLQTEKFPVFLLDEVDDLIQADRHDNWSLFRELRALSQEKRCQFVFAGERVLSEALTDPNGPLFNFTESERIGFLEFQEVQELVSRPLKQVEIHLPEEQSLIRRIWKATGGHPNVVQRLCHQLLMRINKQRPRQIRVTDADAVLTDPRFLREEYLAVLWERATVLERLISLVVARNAGPHSLEMVREALESELGREVKRSEAGAALDRLVQLRSLLTVSERGYCFTIEDFPSVIARTVAAKEQLARLVEKYLDKGDV